MTGAELQLKINNLKQVLTQYESENEAIGICIFKTNSSENWLALTEAGKQFIKNLLPQIINALRYEVLELEEILAPILAQEAEADRIHQEQEAIAEAERLAQEQLEAEALAKTNAILNAINKGKEVILEYLKDNKAIDLTTEQSLQQLQKFAAIKGLLEVGAIDAAVDLLLLAEVDEIFTQERKDKYLLMLA